MGRREEAGDKEESKETFEEKKMEEQEKLRIFREGSIEDAFPQPCNWLFHSAPCALRCKVQTWLTSSSFHKSGLVWLMSLCDSKTFNSKKNAFHVKEMCLLTFIWAKKYMCARVSVWMKNKVEQRKNERERRNWQRERKEVKKTVIWQNISLLNSCVNINQTSNHKLCKVCRKVTNDHSEGKKNKKTQNLFTYFCKKKMLQHKNPLMKCPNICTATLTLALLHVGVELVQCAHGDLSDLRVKQELHEGRGDVLTGRHARSLRYFTLRKSEKTQGKKKGVKWGCCIFFSWFLNRNVKCVVFHC